MCVICYKPAGIQFPSKTKIKTMFNNNPDGAGFMYSDGKAVYIKKGFMLLDEFNRELNKVKERIEYPFVLHFRITTNGGTNKGMCHPFPLSSDEKMLKSTRLKADCGIAHNGIIPLTSYAQKISDTAEFIKKYMSKMFMNGIDDDLLDLVEECINSKMVILEKNQNVHLLGDFVEDGNGVFYSNTSYRKASKTKTKSKSKNNYYGFSSFDSVYFDSYMSYKCYNDECDLCKYEKDCIGQYSDYNPYNPRQYNLEVIRK